MNRKRRLAWSNASLSNLLLQKGSNHRKFFRDSKNNSEKHIFPKLECYNGVKPSEREESDMGGSPGEKWRARGIGEAKEGLENKLWRRLSNGRVREWAVTYIKRRKSWKMSCDIGEASPTSQLILQPFRRFIYVTAHSTALPLLHLVTAHSPAFLSLLLRHRLFTYVTWRAAHVVKPNNINNHRIFSLNLALCGTWVVKIY